MSRVVKLAVIPGDGIGPEVVAEAEKVLDAVTAGSEVVFDKTRFSLGAARYLETGDTLTDADLAAIAGHDAILLGAVGGVPGDPRLKDANIERGLLLTLRFALDHYVNLRPSTLYPSVPGPLRDPGEVDFVVVREGTEGPYVGNGGAIRRGTPHEVANETSVNTAYGVERVVRYAFDLAERRGKKLTLVHKTNVLVNAGSLWHRLVLAVGAEHPTGISTRNASSRRCSSPFTVRPPTSPAPSRPTPRPRSSPSRCCSITSGSPRRPPASPAPSRPTSPRAPTPLARPPPSATRSPRTCRRNLTAPRASRRAFQDVT